MKELLQNAWIVGTVTGIISGLLVYWIVSLLLSKKKDREYQQQVSNANRDVVYAIRSTIPEESLPNRDVVEALIHSTARRYGVQPSELFQPLEIVEELIKEVMDSSFLSSAKKVEYCALLMHLGKETPPKPIVISDGNLGLEAVLGAKELVGVEKDSVVLKRRRSPLDSAFTILISLMVGLITSFATVKRIFPGISTIFHSLETTVWPAIAVPLAFSVVFLGLSQIIDSWKRLKTELKSSRELGNRGDNR